MKPIWILVLIIVGVWWMSRFAIPTSSTLTPTTDSNIYALREQIDQIDRRVMKELAERSRVVQQIWALKAKHKVPITDHAREHEMFLRIRADAQEMGLDQDQVELIYRNIVRKNLLSKN